MIFKYIFTLVLLGSFLHAAPARGGIMSFTQPDGTKFDGVLRGDASFHWIESEGEIVLFNAKDKFYYRALVDESGTIALSNERVGSKIKSRMQKSSAIKEGHTVSAEKSAALMQMYKRSKMSPHPK